MPLEKGCGRAVVSRNISTEMRHGRPQRQAVAIALNTARRSGCSVPPGHAAGSSAIRYSGELVLRISWKESPGPNGTYVVHISRKNERGTRKMSTQYVGAPASLNRAVDSPQAYDDAARAAISFADDDPNTPRVPGEYAATDPNGSWHIGRNPASKWPAGSAGGSARYAPTELGRHVQTEANERKELLRSYNTLATRPLSLPSASTEAGLRNALKKLEIRMRMASRGVAQYRDKTKIKAADDLLSALYRSLLDEQAARMKAASAAREPKEGGVRVVVTNSLTGARHERKWWDVPRAVSWLEGELKSLPAKSTADLYRNEQREPFSHFYSNDYGRVVMGVLPQRAGHASGRTRIVTDTIIAPSEWASALINGDDSGLDDADAAAVSKWVDALAARGWTVVDVVRGKEPYFTSNYRRYGGTAEAGDVREYLLHKLPKR